MALVILAAPCFVFDVAAREPAPVIEASGDLSTSRSDFLEKRIEKLERLLENQTLVDLVMRMDGLQNEIQQLSGRTEEQAHNIEQLKNRQRDLYLDIDRRLRQAEQARASTPAAPATGSVFGEVIPDGAVAGGASGQPAGSSAMSGATQPDVSAGVQAAADPQQERDDYERAFNLLKEGRYDLAVAAFKTFVQKYPRGQFSDNAQYWLGEANYVQRHFQVALAEFEKVIKDYPASPKRADALLKMGYTYQALGQHDKARLSLNDVVMNHPNTTAASLAKKRLQDLKQL
ncbi:MAG: tol-pal system protein YbgF [Gammaproteobacteria bacterium]|nr:tol-pal system protein YbgF [Gammaproteobacteria bacterium]